MVFEESVFVGLFSVVIPVSKLEDVFSLKPTPVPVVDLGSFFSSIDSNSSA